MPNEERSLKKQFIDTGLIKDIKVWCFGKDPVVSPVQVAFAAGAKMFSICAGLTFVCPKVKENNTFKFVFCAKLHSKIYRKDPANRTAWYIWQPIGKSGCLVLDTDKFKELTGVNIYDFTRTNEFKNLQQQFKKVLQKGIDAAIELTPEVPKDEENDYRSYIKSLEEAEEIITQYPDVMDKSYKLINYDRFTSELKKQGYGDELAKRGEIMTKHHRDIGTKFVDKVKQNALKAGEQERLIQQQLKNKQ